MGKTFVIGDIHGSAKALKQVFGKSSFDYQNDKAIFLGDIVDGWSESKECIDFIIDIPNKITIRGNHDEWALYYFTNKTHYLGDEDFTTWKAHGGISTIQSLTENGIVPEKYINFLEDMKYFHEENDKLFVHAGISILTDDDDKVFHPSKQHAYNLCWDRQFINMFYAYRKKTIELNLPWDEIYVGHSPTTSFNDFYTKPQKWHNVWNMDTASAFAGRLSMMNIDTKEVFQSDECRRLHPDEKGRNEVSWNKTKNLFS